MRGRRGAVVGAAVALAAGAALAGCESTQQQAARIRKQGRAQLASEKGVVVRTQSRTVKVLRTGVVQDENGIAVAAVLRNTSGVAAVNVPIAIDVEDAKGASIYKNDEPGLDVSLTSIASIPAGGTATWVDDQVSASGRAAKVDVRVGRSTVRGPREVPQVEIGSPQVVDDPVSGLEWHGTAKSASQVDQTRLVISGVVWRGDRLAAAGRSVIPKLTAAKPQKYTILPIGHPKGASPQIAATPTAAGAPTATK